MAKSSGAGGVRSLKTSAAAAGHANALMAQRSGIQSTINSFRAAGQRQRAGMRLLSGQKLPASGQIAKLTRQQGKLLTQIQKTQARWVVLKQGGK